MIKRYLNNPLDVKFQILYGPLMYEPLSMDIFTFWVKKPLMYGNFFYK